MGIETFADLDAYLRSRRALLHAHYFNGMWLVELHGITARLLMRGEGQTLLDAVKDAVAKLETRT